MPIIKNKKSLIRASGVTLIEVMIVLAISGVLIVAAIATLGARSNLFLEQNTRQAENNVLTVYNEAKSGLGPSGVTNITNVNENPYAISSSPLGTGEEIFGQAVVMENSCGGTEHCILVLKLKKTSGAPETIMPYEKYRIDLPSGFEYKSTTATGLSGPIPVYSPASGLTPMVVFTSQGRAFVFDRTSGVGNAMSAAAFPSPANDPTSYAIPYTSGVVTYRFEDTGNPSKFFNLVVNLANPGDVKLELP